MNKDISTIDLDAQSVINIDYWIDVDSAEAKEKDSDRKITKKFMMIGFEEGVLFTDSSGRIWGYNKEKNIYYPFHFEYENKLIGFKISKKAAN